MKRTASDASPRAPATAPAVAALVAVCGLAALGAVGWRPAEPAYRIALPRDHASHPDRRIEWWYYTGNVTTEGGRRFGYQLTFFRFGVDPAPVNPSRWAVRDLFMAHAAVSDAAGRKHVYADRLNRAGIGWAGALTDRYRVWNEDWQASLDVEGRHRLRAVDGDLGIDLTLEPGKAPVLHGRDGYSQKGPTPGNASHYYSLTRMPTVGTLRVGGVDLKVSGTSWMDHEFGSSFLEPGQVGWDWISVQFDDRTDLMLYGIRRADGQLDPFAGGTLVDADGRAQHLDAQAFTMTPLTRWTSPESGAAYPVAWRVEVPSWSLVAEVEAVFPAQELRTERSTTVTYWEGAIDARGTRGGRPVRGQGYLEMTGYAGRPMSDVLR